MHLEEYIPWIYLDSAIREGLVSTSIDDTGLLVIYNYTPKAMFSPGAWNNPAVRKSRGLIVDTISQEIIARPWEKFFNWGQPEAEISLDSVVEVTDKADGSLGIIYYHPYLKKLMVATRGSFNSEQANHANKILHKYLSPYKAKLVIEHVLTPLVEIIYPENRIVLDYGDNDELVLLGAVTEQPLALDGSNGKYLGPHFTSALLRWDGPVTHSFGYMSIKDALSMPPRDNAEGLCLKYVYEDKIIKVKQEDYIALHKIISNLSEKTVWEALMHNVSLEDVLAPLPDELHQWTRDTYASFKRRADTIISLAWSEYADLISTHFDGLEENALKDRKRFSELAKRTTYPQYMFMQLDSKPLYQKILYTLKPVGANPARKMEPE